MIRNELQRYNMDNAKQKSTHYSTIFLLLYYPFHAIAHPSHLFYFQGITLSPCKMISKIQLIGNKQVTLFVKLNR